MDSKLPSSSLTHKQPIHFPQTLSLLTVFNSPSLIEQPLIRRRRFLRPPRCGFYHSSVRCFRLRVRCTFNLSVEVLNSEIKET
ncbi:hypothetical protein RJT34_27480 [Clitoria ternatea]|uniref:Uncharacterized protein n=1 Tax=Clitoria ternatea TaxID=43366 RepID=A0AAN9FCM1_CLITE